MDLKSYRIFYIITSSNYLLECLNNFDGIWVNLVRKENINFLYGLVQFGYILYSWNQNWALTRWKIKNLE